MVFQPSQSITGIAAVDTAAEIDSSLVKAQAGSALTMEGQIADGASAIANILDNVGALSTSGAKLLSIRNNGTEKAYVDYQGGLVSLTASGQNALTMNSGALISFASGYTAGISSTSLAVTANTTATGTAVILNNTTTMTAGGKILSIQNSGSEKVSVDYTGNIVSTGTVTATKYTVSSASANIQGTMADGGSAVGTIIDTNATYSTSGSKLLSVRNNGTEKAYIDKSGQMTLSSGITLSGASGFASGNNASFFLQGGSICQGITGAVNTVAGGASTVIFTASNSTSQVKFTVNAAGGKLSFTANASDSCVGNATLVGGTVTISTTAVTASSLIYLSHRGSATANMGVLYPGTIVAGTSFVINSSNASDTDGVNWWIVN